MLNKEDLVAKEEHDKLLNVLIKNYEMTTCLNRIVYFSIAPCFVSSQAQI